jgi:hypothetical protein
MKVSETKKAKKSDVNDPLSVGKHVGQHIFGYEVLPDGWVRLAPCMTEKIDAILIRKRAIDQLVRSVLEFAAEAHRQIETDSSAWWAPIIKEFGGKNWSYDGPAKAICPLPDKASTLAKEQESANG